MRPAILRQLLLLAALLPDDVAAQDGRLDFTFAGDGDLVIEFPGYFTGEAAGSFTQPDGRIVVFGQECAVHCNPAAARLLPNGTFDTSWSDDGKVAFAYAGQSGGTGLAALRADGKVVFAGVLPAGRLGLARLTAEGLFDPTFGSGANPGSIVYSELADGGTILEVTSLALQNDGRIVVGGAAAQPGFTDSDFFIARFTATGQVDTSFSTDGVAYVAFDLPPYMYDAIADLAIQPDGRIVALGRATDGNGESDLAFARLTTAGALDPTFDGESGTGNGRFRWEVTDIFGEVADIPLALTLPPEGRILFASRHYSPGEASVFVFGRLLASGAIDPVLPVRESYAWSNDILVEPSGKIVLSGSYFLPSGVRACALERWDADGAGLDPSFSYQGFLVHPFGEADTNCGQVAQSGEHLVVTGWFAEPEPSIDVDFHVVRFRSSLFSDDFNRGDLDPWSSTSP
jgi:uncharacterized delta-60 repeat protein